MTATARAPRDLETAQEIAALFAAAFPAPKRATPHPDAKDAERRARKRMKARRFEARKPATLDDMRATAIDYARWLAARDGVALPDNSGDSYSVKTSISVEVDHIADEFGKCRQRVKAVSWIRTTTRQLPKAKRRGYQWEREESTVETLATIQIPNWDFVPTVIDLSEAE